MSALPHTAFVLTRYGRFFRVTWIRAELFAIRFWLIFCDDRYCDGGGFEHIITAHNNERLSRIAGSTQVAMSFLLSKSFESIDDTMYETLL